MSSEYSWHDLHYVIYISKKKIRSQIGNIPLLYKTVVTRGTANNKQKINQITKVRKKVWVRLYR